VDDHLSFEGADVLRQSWCDGLKPDPLLTVSEWSDAHRFLSPRASAEPGRYRTDRTPYMRAIMDALSPSHPARRIVFMKAAQVGATEAGNNWIGYVIHHAPGPMLGVTWPHANGAQLGLAKLAIDTGYESPAVYAWARRAGHAQVAPIKGVEGFNRAAPVAGPTHVDATEGGKKLRRGARLWTVAVATFKSETYRFLRLPKPTDDEIAAGSAWPAGYMHLPRGVDAEWVKQLVAEQLVTVKTKRGFQRLEWQKLRERNEASIAASMPAPRPGSLGPIAGTKRCGATSNGRWASRRKRQRTSRSSGRPHPLTWPTWFGAGPPRQSRRVFRSSYML
jgi:phage terminase large subunit GpA-like protein